MRAMVLSSLMVSIAMVMGWGGVSAVRSELRAVVEDSTTIVVMRGDRVVFRKEMGFAREIVSEVQAKELDFGRAALAFSYVSRDSSVTNPSLGIPTDGDARGHLVVIDREGQSILSADARWCGLHRGVLRQLERDNLESVYATGEGGCHEQSRATTS